MSAWMIFDYAELSGKNKIVEWLEGLPPADRAIIDNRLLKMAGSAVWPEKWVSSYKCAGKIFEFRIKGKNIQYRPLGTYFGTRRYVILNGAIEKGDKIPKSDIDIAIERQVRVKGNEKHAVPHQF